MLEPWQAEPANATCTRVDGNVVGRGGRPRRSTATGEGDRNRKCSRHTHSCLCPPFWPSWMLLPANTDGWPDGGAMPRLVGTPLRAVRPLRCHFSLAVPGFLTPRRQALRTCSIAHDVSPIYQQCGDVQSRGVLVEWVDCSTICMSAVAAAFSLRMAYSGWQLHPAKKAQVLSTKFRPLFSLLVETLSLRSTLKYISPNRDQRLWVRD